MKVPEQQPSGLPAPALQLWKSGLPDTEIRAGDMWVLSWDGEVVGHALIAGVQDNFALTFPLSLPGEPSFAPGLRIDPTPLQVPLTVWATRETGIGNHLLDRNLGPLLAPERIRAVIQNLDDGSDPGLPFAEGSASDPTNEAADRQFVDHWTELCFNEGGFTDRLYLDTEAIKAFGIGSRRTSELLGLPHPEFVQLWKGILAITDAQVETLAEHLRAAPESLVTSDPFKVVLPRLADPQYKRLITERLPETGMDETEFRLAVRAEFALAARDDGDALTDRKLRDAIQRVGR